MKSTDPKYNICYNARRFCNEDISLIENYSQMMQDTTQKWCCHHRREISEHKSKKQLIAEGRYYKVPATELIFMPYSEHSILHNNGNKNGVGNKSRRGKHNSEATKQKQSEAQKGKHWFNNGIKNVFAKECPGEGFIAGRIRKETSL